MEKRGAWSTRFTASCARAGESSEEMKALSSEQRWNVRAMSALLLRQKFFSYYYTCRVNVNTQRVAIPIALRQIEKTFDLFEVRWDNFSELILIFFNILEHLENYKLSKVRIQRCRRESKRLLNIYPSLYGDQLVALPNDRKRSRGSYGSARGWPVCMVQRPGILCNLIYRG